MINCLIVDDDVISRKCLEELIRKIKNQKLIASCSNVIEAREFLKGSTIDVLFLHIEMPEISGIEFRHPYHHEVMEGKLPRDHFLRVHRSFIVCLNKINAIEDTLILIGKKLIPTGESYRADLMNHLKFI